MLMPAVAFSDKPKIARKQTSSKLPNTGFVKRSQATGSAFKHYRQAHRTSMNLPWVLDVKMMLLLPSTGIQSFGSMVNALSTSKVLITWEIWPTLYMHRVGIQSCWLFDLQLVSRATSKSAALVPLFSIWHRLLALRLNCCTLIALSRTHAVMPSCGKLHNRM